MDGARGAQPLEFTRSMPDEFLAGRTTAHVLEGLLPFLAGQETLEQIDALVIIEMGSGMKAAHRSPPES